VPVFELKEKFGGSLAGPNINLYSALFLSSHSKVGDKSDTISVKSGEITVVEIPIVKFPDSTDVVA